MNNHEGEATPYFLILDYFFSTLIKNIQLKNTWNIIKLGITLFFFLPSLEI